MPSDEAKECADLSRRCQVLSRNTSYNCTVDWTWLKRFRLWEANRKVFLEPESYVEPERRDDKEPAFPPKPRFRRRRRTKSDADE